MPSRIPSHMPAPLGVKVRQRRGQDNKPPELREFYGSMRWQRIRAMKRQANPLCEVCEAEGRMTDAELVHHVTPVREEMSDALLMANLQSVCRACHGILHACR
jgi:5-methylcytosine-specific restriction enzyme A